MQHISCGTACDVCNLSGVVLGRFTLEYALRIGIGMENQRGEDE